MKILAHFQVSLHLCFVFFLGADKSVTTLSIEKLNKLISRTETSCGSPCVVHDGVEAVSNGEYSALSKLCTNGALDKVISLKVNSCSCLIQNQDFGFAQQCPC